MELLTFDITNDFIVGDLITKETLYKYSKSPHKLKASFFILCMEGSLEASISLTKFTIRKNDLITLAPSNYIQIHHVSDDARFYFAGFSADFMKNINFIKSSIYFISLISEHPIISLKESIAQLYIGGYELLLNAQELSPNKQLDNKNLIIAYLTIFIQATSELYRNNTHWSHTATNRNNEIYRKFIQLAVDHYSSEHSVTFYADQLNLSLPHFCTTIKKAVGFTPLEILSSIIIMDAKAQIRSTDLTIKEIAFSLGFTNLSFFYRFFKRQAGMTPKEYRQLKSNPDL